MIKKALFLAALVVVGLMAPSPVSASSASVQSILIGRSAVHVLKFSYDPVQGDVTLLFDRKGRLDYRSLIVPKSGVQQRREGPIKMVDSTPTTLGDLPRATIHMGKIPKDATMSFQVCTYFGGSQAPIYETSWFSE